MHPGGWYKIWGAAPQLTTRGGGVNLKALDICDLTRQRTATDPRAFRHRVENRAQRKFGGSTKVFYLCSTRAKG